MLFMKSAFETV